MGNSLGCSLSMWNVLTCNLCAGSKDIHKNITNKDHKKRRDTITKKNINKLTKK